MHTRDYRFENQHGYLIEFKVIVIWTMERVFARRAHGREHTR